jgi:hypothetical protein
MDHIGRRAGPTVLLVALLVFAGCTTALGPSGAGTGSPTTTPVPPPSATPTADPSATPGECEAVEQRTVDPFRDDVEPSEFLDPPAAWNRSSVERYVVAFEEAYARNGALREESTRVDVLVAEVSVERRDGAWVVDLVSRTNTWAQGRATGTATATVVHGDGARVPVTYRLTDRALYREEGRVGGTPSGSAASTRAPRDGRTVRCFET